MSGWNADTVKRTLNEIEGYVLWEAEKGDAAARARAFSARLSWLTAAEREEVESLYAEDQLAVATTYLRRVAARGAELRHAYLTRYLLLRRRLFAAFLAALALAVGLTVGLVSGLCGGL